MEAALGRDELVGSWAMPLCNGRGCSGPGSHGECDRLVSLISRRDEQVPCPVPKLRRIP
jgi:hypothetical protein